METPFTMTSCVLKDPGKGPFQCSFPSRGQKPDKVHIPHFQIASPLWPSQTLNVVQPSGKLGKANLPKGFILPLCFGKLGSGGWPQRGPTPHFSPWLLLSLDFPPSVSFIQRSAGHLVSAKAPEAGEISAAMEPLCISKRIQSGKRNPDRQF